MSTDPTSSDSLRSWRAQDWEDLRSVWSELMMKYQEGEARFRKQSLEDRDAGWVFERWIMEAFRLSGAQGHDRFENRMKDPSFLLEEIDGLVFSGWQGFLIESKFEQDKVDAEPLYRLQALCGNRPAGTLGLVFSASGFTTPALAQARMLRPMHVLLFDSTDLRWAMDAPSGMMEMVHKKWILALRSGQPHLPVSQPLELFPKGPANAIVPGSASH